MLGLAVAGNVEGGEKLLLAAVKANEKAAKLESAFDLLTCDWVFSRTHHALSLTHNMCSIFY